MQTVLILLLKYKYWILFPLAAFEGPVISIVVGFLVYSGVFNFYLAFIILLFGDIIPDTIYFYIGYFSDKSKFIQKHFLKSKFVTNHMDILAHLWTNHTRKMMFFGKLAYGMATPFLISAGIMKMSYRKFIYNALPVTILQYGVLMGVGYYLGNSYNLAAKYLDYGYIIIAIVVIIIVAIYVAIIKYARRKIIVMENEKTN